MMMIDMEGHVHRAQGSVDMGANEAAASLDTESDNVEPTQSEPVFLESESQSEQLLSPHQEIAKTGVVAQEANETPPSDLEVSAEPVAATNDNYNWFDQQLDQQESTSKPETAAEAFADIASFGNQDQEIDAIQFDVVISGIDHKDLAAEVHKVLSDNRLFLSSKELLPSNGTLVLSGISAARANLIVTRLKHLKIQINWSQKIYEN